MIRWRHTAGIAAALGISTLSARATPSEPRDYDPQSWAWNGMAQFAALAEGMGFEVSPVSSLEWSTLGRNDILFLIYPQHRVDPKLLSDFVQAGGNAVVADDFGEAGDAMAQLGILRTRAEAPAATRYYEGKPWAPIATVQGTHFLTRDVVEVVANHPKALERVADATTVVGFTDSALVVAGERGTGKFVAVADPSIFINRMQQEPFHGNVQLAANILRWLSRGGSAHRVVLFFGDAAMFGEPQPFIDNPGSSAFDLAVAELNAWMYQRREWLLTATAMHVLSVGLSVALILLVIAALPVHRGRNIHGLWLRFARPVRRDDPYELLREADSPGGAASSLLVAACILRDRVQGILAEVIGPGATAYQPEPLYTFAEDELIARVTAAKGSPAGAALTKVYRRLRALPSRGQAAAPWSTGALQRSEFESLYTDVRELCRTLGRDFIAA